MAFINNWENILIAFLIVIAVVLIILEILERKLHKKLIRKKDSKNKEYIQKLKKIKIPQKEIALNKLNNIAVNFFKEAFKIKGTVEFSELKTFFKEKNKTEESTFCEELERKLFSGRETNTKDIKKLIKKLIRIINKNHIYTKKEEKELKERKLKEKKGIRKLLKKVKIPGICNKKVKNNQKNRKKN